MHTPPNNAAKLAYSIQEVMAIVALGRDVIYRRIASGELKARKCGRRTLVLHSDLECFLRRLSETRDAAHRGRRFSFHWGGQVAAHRVLQTHQRTEVQVLAAPTTGLRRLLDGAHA